MPETSTTVALVPSENIERRNSVIEYLFTDLSELPEADDTLVDKMLHTADEIEFKERIWKA